MISTKLFFLKIALNKLLLNAGRESLLLNSKDNVFESLQALTKKDFPPSVSRIYLRQTTYILTAMSANNKVQKAPQISSAIGYRISTCKRNTMRKVKCINLQMILGPKFVTEYLCQR